MNINDLGKLLGKPPIIAPKPVTTTVNLDACARIVAHAQEAVQDRPIVIRTCPVCRMPHPSDVHCKPGEVVS